MEDLHPVALFVVVFAIAFAATFAVCVLPQWPLHLYFRNTAQASQVRPEGDALAKEVGSPIQRQEAQESHSYACSLTGCDKPTWNGQPNEYCGDRHREAAAIGPQSFAGVVPTPERHAMGESPRVCPPSPAAVASVIGAATSKSPALPMGPSPSVKFADASSVDADLPMMAARKSLKRDTAFYLSQLLDEEEIAANPPAIPQGGSQSSGSVVAQGTGGLVRTRTDIFNQIVEEVAPRAAETEWTPIRTDDVDQIIEQAACSSTGSSEVRSIPASPWRSEVSVLLVEAQNMSGTGSQSMTSPDQR